MPLAAGSVHLVPAALDHVGDVFVGGSGDDADQRRVLLQAEAAVLDDEFVEAFEGSFDGWLWVGVALEAAASAASFVDEAVEGRCDCSVC